jgi:hypothetical protein
MRLHALLQLHNYMSEGKISRTEENKLGNDRRRNILAALALLLPPDFKFVIIFEKKERYRCGHFMCSFPRSNGVL